MENELDLGDCVRMTANHIADFCMRTDLDHYAIRLALLKGTVMRVNDNEVFVEWDDGEVGFHQSQDLEKCADI